jgi:polysaccharide biosynthesis transport protein
VAIQKQPEEQSSTEIIKKYAILLWHWLWLIILVTILASGAVYFIGSRQTPMYQATALVMINVSSNTMDISTSAYLAQTFGASYADIMTSRTVLDAVAKRLKLSNLDLQNLSGSVHVTQVVDSQLLNVTATSTNPDRAALIANTIVAVFNEQNSADQTAAYAGSKKSLQNEMDGIYQQILTTSANLAVVQQKIQDDNNLLTSFQSDVLAEKTPEELNQRANTIQGTQTELQSLASENAKLNVELESFKNSYSTLDSSFQAIRQAESQVTSGVLLKDPAISPNLPFQPKPIRNALVAAVLVFILCVAVIFLLDYLDDTFKTPEDISRYLGLSVVGMIGEMEHKQNGSGMVYVGENPRSPIAEAYRLLRSNLEFVSVDQPLHTILVSSVGPQVGKTTVAINLAVIIAQGGKRVLLMDSDLRRPTVHRQLNIQNRAGLSDLFLADAGDVTKVCSWGDTKISAITSGPLPPNPTDLLGSEKFKQILSKLKESFDVIIMDSAPSIVSDPIILSTKVDGVLLVIKPGSTKIGPAQVMMEQFQRAGARMVGVVLNPISRNRAKYSSKYDFYSKYYQSNSVAYYSDERKKKGKKGLTLGKAPGNVSE